MGARVALAALAAPAPAAAGPPPLHPAVPETTEVRTGPYAPESGPWALAHRFILVGSEVLRLGERALVREVDYRLDADAGSVRLAAPLAAADTLRIDYAWVPLDLPRDFVAVARGEPTPADSTRPILESVSPADRFAQAVDSDLVIGGAKTFSIEAGSNKDADVEQSLRVSVTGRIGESVRLTALLSDQNIPLQPEGDTQRLEELDEVLIRLDGPAGSATLGDFVARREGTAFGDFERRLSGAEGTVRAGPGSARGVGASTRGDFRTVEFRGEEGKQGPYVLAGSGPNPSGVIVAGSEQVWMDGIRLTRGDTNDYVIDYARGEIEFTNRRLVTSDSEIAVDFEVAEQAYSRDFFLGEGAVATEGGALAWRTSIAAEVDSDDPVSTSLDDARRAALAAAGDEPVLVPGAVCGLEDGDYVQRGDIFEYAGRDSGTCDVSFTFVGDGAGDYVRDRDLDTGLAFYRHVGAGAGDWTPGLLLTAPRTATLADMALRARGGGFDVAADAALSREDRNTLSDLDDEDDDGAAGKVAVGWGAEGPEAFGDRLRFRADASWRGEEAEFRSLGRTRDAWLGEVWNFTDDVRTDESVGEIGGRVEAGDRWALGGTWGRLDRPGRFRSDRRSGDARWSGPRNTRATVRSESVRREDAADSTGTRLGDLRRDRAEVGTRVGWLAPGASFWREDRVESRAGVRESGRDQLEWAGSLGIAPDRGPVSGDIRFARRTTDVVDGGTWVRDTVARTWEVRADAARSRSVRARLSWIRRDLDAAEGRPVADRTTTLTRGDLSHDSFGGRVRGEWTYETTSRTFADQLAAPGTDEEPTLAVTASARVRIGAGSGVRPRAGGGASGLDRWLARLQSETVVRVEEESTTKDRARIYLLDLSRFQNDEETVFGKMLLRQEVTVFPGAGPVTVTGRWERIDTEDNRADPDRIEIVSERSVVRATTRLGPRWSLETQGTREEDSRSDSAFGRVDFDVRRLELREELTWQPHPTRRIAGRVAVLDERNDADESSVRGIALGLSSTLAILRRGRWASDVSWSRPVQSDGIDRADRFRTRENDQLDWRTSVDLRLSDSINASLTWSGRALAGAPTTHLARAEARALV